MAVEYINAVYCLDRDDLNATEIGILAYLANKADPSGACWPKRSTIAEACHLHPDTVKLVLRGLADKLLISKEAKVLNGRPVSVAIQLLFAPLKTEAPGRGQLRPKRGASTPQSMSRKGGGKRSGDGGSRIPLHKNHQEEPSDTPLKSPLGDIVTAIWEETPKVARERSSTADLREVIQIAVRDGATADQLLAALRSHYSTPDVIRDGGKWMKGVHRLFAKGRWRDWLPEQGEAAPPLVAAAAKPSPDMQDRIWRSRMEDFKRIEAWDRRRYGQRPGEARRDGELPCQCPPAILREFGFEPVQ